MAKQFQVDTGGTLTNGLLSYFKLEDSTDFYGTNNGTNSNGTFISGKVNNAWNGNGTNANLTSSLSIGMGAVSVNFWIKINENPANGTNTCLNYNYSGAGTNQAVMCKLYYNTSGGVQQLRTVNSNDSAFTGTYNVNLNDGNWHMITYTTDAFGGTQRIFVDKILRATSTQGSVASSNTSGQGIHTIGCDAGGTIQFSNSVIDEAGYWNRQLTDGGISIGGTATGEIADLYNGGSGQTMIVSNNAGFFLFF